ncbi:MAG: phosphoglycolate phosphatase [Proteobacteria bacterium]|nr:phosphoglycolate phosphatase [Pseudomonadota bacterium]
MAEPPQSGAPAIVFDLDGTLVDTAPDLLAALNAVLAKAGHRRIVPDELRHLVGYGVRALFEQAFTETGTRATPEQFQRYTEEFLSYYRANIATFSRPFPGVPETLVALGRSGARLGVCTNKPHDLTELLLDQLDLKRHFQAIVGAGHASHNKPDPRHVFAVIDALGGTAERAIMVGDSSVDVAAARAAKIPVIVVSYGYTTKPVHELGADAIVDDFTALPGMIEKLLG